MMAFFVRTVCKLVVVGMAASSGVDVWGAEQREIRPPFELIWHESADRLDRLIRNANLTVVERTRSAALSSLTVTGFKKPNPKDPAAPKPPELKRVVFSFKQEQLWAVELQYEQAGWGNGEYDQSFAQKRDALDKLYGKGQTLLRETRPAPAGSGDQTVVSALWNRNNASIELSYYALESGNPALAYRCLSLRYTVRE
jgi:hypothetical protein